MPKYKNISQEDLSLPNIGIVKSGEEIDQPEGFNNANFQKVGETKQEVSQKKEEKANEETN